MTYATDKATSGHTPTTSVILGYERCSLTYGVSPCTASGSAGSECYNSRKTCQDSANFTRQETTITFVTPSALRPLHDEHTFPCLIGTPEIAPIQAQPGNLSDRAVVTVTLKDFEHHDRAYDPYWETRASPATGTFLARFFARYPYIEGRSLIIRREYLSADGSSTYQDYHYFMDVVSGPTNYQWTLKARDLLAFADNDTIQLPPLSAGVLVGDIAAGDTAATLDDGSTYAASGTARIGDELVTFTRSGNALTLVRGLYGTAPDDHSDGDTVQECIVYTAANVVEVVGDILVNYAGIDPAYLAYDAIQTTPTGTPDQWDLEQDRWLSVLNLTRVVSEPTGALDLLQAICEQTQIMLFWDPVSAKLYLFANVPPYLNAAPTALTDDQFVRGSVQLIRDAKSRLSQVWVWCSPRNQIETDKAAYYTQGYEHWDQEREGANLYGKSAVRVILADWLHSLNSAYRLARRLLERYADPPYFARFQLEAQQASLGVGDNITITTRELIDESGAMKTLNFQITSLEEIAPGHLYQYEAIQSDFDNRYGFIGSNTATADYASATSTEKQTMCYICGADGLIYNGDTGYLIQ